MDHTDHTFIVDGDTGLRCPYVMHCAPMCGPQGPTNPWASQ